MTQIMFHHPSAPRFFHGVFAHVTAVSILALLCMVAGLSQVRTGPVSRQPAARAAGRGAPGRERRVEGSYPAEVQPLVNDLNALLDHREQAVRRAVAESGRPRARPEDAARGADTRSRARRRRRPARAGRRRRQQVERMRRQVDYHLAHARAAASGATPGARCSVAESADGLARTLRAAPRRPRTDDRRSRATRAFGPRPARGPRRDARQPPRQRLQVGQSPASPSSRPPADQSIVITVDDDGPGIDPSMRESCCSAACAPTRRRRAPASDSRSFAIWPSSTAARSLSTAVAGWRRARAAHAPGGRLTSRAHAARRVRAVTSLLPQRFTPPRQSSPA